MVVSSPKAGTAAKPLTVLRMPAAELYEELLDDTELTLLLDELAAELELLITDEEEDEEDEEDDAEEAREDEDELVVPGAEHSLTPPDTLLPAPKVASEHTKLPESVLNVNLSARPKATLVVTGTEQVLFSVQIVV